MSLTIERANVLPELESSVRDQFVEALTRRCAEVLGLTGFLKNLGGRDLVIDTLDLRISATAHEVTHDPRRYGAHAGAGLAARIIAKNQRSGVAAPGLPKVAAMVDCLKCKHRVRLTATCMYCGAALAAPPIGGANVNRQHLIEAAFKAAGWISDVGLGVREIDKQYAQDILENLGLASKISILDLGTAVRAPRSDLDYALAVDGTTDVQFVRVHQAMQQVGFEANAGGLANRFLDLDDLLRQAKAGVLSGNLVTKLLKAEHLAGAPAQRAKVEAIKLAVISNPKYLEWLKAEVKGRPITGPVMGAAFHLKDTSGGIRDLQHLSWLSAFLSRTPHDAFEHFDGLVKAGHITADEATTLQKALTIFRELRRAQHIAAGKELDSYAGALAAGAAERLGIPADQLHSTAQRALDESRRILAKIQAKL